MMISFRKIDRKEDISKKLSFSLLTLLDLTDISVKRNLPIYRIEKGPVSN